MNKNTQIAISILILLLVGGIIYMFVNPTFQKNRIADVSGNPVPDLDSAQSSAPAGTTVTMGGESPASSTPTAQPASSSSTPLTNEKAIKMTTTADGLQISIIQEGTGPEAKAGDKVTVHYTGTFTDGKKFDSSVDRGEPFTFQLGAHMVIQGWDEGVAGMKVGEKRKLVIPYQLAYGENDYGPIPGKSTLLFDVELLKIN